MLSAYYDDQKDFDYQHEPEKAFEPCRLLAELYAKQNQPQEAMKFYLAAREGRPPGRLVLPRAIQLKEVLSSLRFADKRKSIPESFFTRELKYVQDAEKTDFPD